MRAKRSLLIILLFCIVATVGGIYLIGGVEQAQIEVWLTQAGIFAPIIYILLYTVGTLLILPSTPLNLAGGAIFGLWWGLLWTTIAALLAAIVAFAFTRTLGREWIAQRLSGRWEALDAEMRHGGLFYMAAIRFLPIIPYGLVNFAAGLTSMRWRDYILGTLIGTVPGILPFVMMGSGLQALRQGNVVPILVGFALTGMLIAIATWYRRQRQAPTIERGETPTAPEPKSRRFK